ncbi:FGGY family carbohydrate kinase [Oscillospiraceae bacterium MB08-C2-2]|nr:FGGY family carbohydrate kinase [Oscillospiraceae bacterium MB08-C2-2]
MHYYIGIDFGSTNIKVAAYTLAGETAHIESRPNRVTHPRPDWSDFDIDGIWAGIQESLQIITAKLGAANIRAVSFSSMGEPAVPIDKEGTPLYPTMAWYDMRSLPQLEYINNKIGRRRLYEITGQVPDPKFAISKIVFLQQNHPEIFEKIHKWLPLPDYVAYLLTGEQFTDYSIASRTMCFDVTNLCWSREILEPLGISPDIFPPTIPGATRRGEITTAAQELTGLLKGTPVVAGGHDHSCAAITVNIWEDGVVLDSMGTAESCMVAIDKMNFSDHGYENAICMYPHCTDKLYRAISGFNACGASVEWYLKTIGRAIVLEAEAQGRNRFELMNEKAAKEVTDIPSMVYLPFLRGSRHNSNVRGGFVGISDGHLDGDYVNALLEGLCCEFRSIAQEYETLFGISCNRIQAVGGGSRDPYWMQIKANVMKNTVYVPANREGASMGAAFLGAVGMGDIDFAGLAAMKRPGDTYKPAADAQGEKIFEKYCKAKAHLISYYE